MLYWISLLSILFITSILGISTSLYKDRRFIVVILGFILIYFSSFRLGLGTDYSGYVEKYYWETSTEVVNLLDEPLFTIISIFINNLGLTPLVLFLVFSTITIVGILSFYNRKDNIYWASSIALFVLLPILYFNSFNLVRQFAATGFFFYSIRYVDKKRFIPYLICVILAMSCHLTAIFLLPLFFFINKKFSPQIIVISFLVAFLTFSTILNPLIEASILLNDRFSTYLNSTDQMGASGMILLYNIIAVYMLFIKDKFNSQMEIISYNLFFLFVLFSDLSFVNYFFFRIAVYFSPVFAYILPKVVGVTVGKSYSICVSWLFGLVFLFMFLFNNLNNPIVVPSGILPFSSLWDASLYQRVYNIY